MMRESVIYQEILHEGEERGRQTERRSLISLQLEQRVGSLSDAQRDRISTLNLDRLGALAGSFAVPEATHYSTSPAKTTWTLGSTNICEPELSLTVEGE